VDRLVYPITPAGYGLTALAAGTCCFGACTGGHRSGFGVSDCRFGVSGAGLSERRTAMNVAALMRSWTGFRQRLEHFEPCGRRGFRSRAGSRVSCLSSCVG